MIKSPIDNESFLLKGRQLQKAGRTIVFTSGVFDIIHIGHLQTLAAAADKGNFLFCAINSDKSVRQKKGTNRPIISEDARAKFVNWHAKVTHLGG